MKRLSRSLTIYIALAITLAILAALNVFLPQGQFSSLLPEQELPAPKPVMALVSAVIMLVLYGGLGLIGLVLSRKLCFPDIWDDKISNRQRFLVPMLIGAGLGILFIIVDTIVGRLHPLGALPHPPFPTSLVASATAGIGEEIIFRLFFISFWVWLISHVILRNRGQSLVFGVVATLSGLVFALGHLPSVMLLYGLTQVNQVPLTLLGEILLLNGALSFLAAYSWKKYGFLAAIGIHFWTDVVWHVVWGAILLQVLQ